jgi:hypothetical protein
VLTLIVYWALKSSKLPTCYHRVIWLMTKEPTTELKCKMRTRLTGSALPGPHFAFDWVEKVRSEKGTSTDMPSRPH